VVGVTVTLCVIEGEGVADGITVTQGFVPSSTTGSIGSISHTLKYRSMVESIGGRFIGLQIRQTQHAPPEVVERPRYGHGLTPPLQ